MRKEPVLTIEKPHFLVRVYENLIEVDLKEGAKKGLEDVIEAYPTLRESLGILFQTIFPLDVALHKIESAEVEKSGHVKIVVPLRRDIVIPLETNESERLVDKLKELIPSARAHYGPISYPISEGTTASKRTC